MSFTHVFSLCSSTEKLRRSKQDVFWLQDQYSILENFRTQSELFKHQFLFEKCSTVTEVMKAIRFYLKREQKGLLAYTDRQSINVDAQIGT